MSDWVVPVIVTALVITIGLVIFLVAHSHVKQRDVKRTNDRLNQGH